MTEIYLIRHAEAEGNLYRRNHGQYESNVTPLGRKQIAALAERFKDIPVDSLWSSDMVRTQTTASAILKYHPELTIQTEPRLREMNVGVWEDVPWGNLGRDWPEQMRLFAADPERFSVPGSEGFFATAERVRAALLDIGAANEGKTVAVFSHGMAIRALLCLLQGIPSNEVNRVPHGDNTAVHHLYYEDGTLRLDYFNDNRHLDESTSTFARQTWWRKKAGGTEDPENICCGPLDPVREAELYNRCYAATWAASHGDTEGYVPALYLSTAREHARQDPALVYKFTKEGRFVGMVELDADKGKAWNSGWISLLYVEPEFRNQRLGIQLLGHAVCYFRAMGRERLCLHVADTNEKAVGFYLHNGFEERGRNSGVAGYQWLMQADIRPQIWKLP